MVMVSKSKKTTGASKGKSANPALLSAWIHKRYLDEDTIKHLALVYKRAKPYPHLQLADFFNEKKMLAVLKALCKEHFFVKESDLFKFKQTADLKGTQSKVLKEYIDFLYSKEFVDYMQRLTGHTFTQTVDIAGTLYEDTDFLLCHDDQLDDRKIAFLSYLTTIKSMHGASLALYSHTKKGKIFLPKDVVKRIHPTFNKLAFFEVSPISFHEVEEVTGNTKRIAVGGWYYGKR
ncbi:MAG TPA: 2OG-Fe(II) oxygenase family protein [Acidobacteriota bacterium]|nr:2OG-Fe(II) oxygenase family protein [Acidobacteriota bacterium]